VLPSGSVKCWGGETAQFGQLGDGNGSSSPIPVEVVALAGEAKIVAVGRYHSCALLVPGGVRCWGLRYSDFARIFNYSTTPVDFPEWLSGVNSLAARQYGTCALLDRGSVECWSNRDAGPPYEVASSATSVSSGYGHSCAVLSTAKVQCWGQNSDGQLGELASLSDVVAITAGDSHTCALLIAGNVKCWGSNSWGQLGFRSPFKSPTPVDVPGLSSGVAAIAAGGLHTCALLITGVVKCWGNNGGGQVGNGTRTTLPVTPPVTVAGLRARVTSINAGAGHTCVLLSIGGAQCWGDNSYGQLGDGTNSWRVVPTDVVGLPSNGGSPTRSYTATAVEDPSKSCTISAPASTCTITGLTTGQTYTFTVTATNAIGTSIPSAPSDPVTIP
jgi:alpha-tubulin suppressor-like RCC1 family protein